MSLIYLILVIGMTASVLTIAVFIVADRILERRRRGSFDARIGKNYLSPPAVNPGLLLSKLGSKQSAQRSLDTMILRPTWGIKLFGLIISALLISVMMGPSGAVYRDDLITWGLVASVLGYFGVFLSFYEVRYDSEGITAPNMLFRPKFHPWSEFVSVHRADNIHYKLIFEGGTLEIKKFLVGIPTLLTFVTDIQEMQKET